MDSDDDDDDEMQNMLKWQMMMNKSGKQKKESNMKVAQLIEAQSEMMGEIARQIGEKKRKEQEDEHLHYLRKKLTELENKYEEKRRKDEFNFQKSMNDMLSEQMMGMGAMGAPSSADTLMFMVNQNMQNQLPGAMGIRNQNEPGGMHMPIMQGGQVTGDGNALGGIPAELTGGQPQPKASQIPNPLQLPNGFPQSLFDQNRNRQSQMDMNRKPGPFDMILNNPALMAHMKPKDMLLLDYLSKKNNVAQPRPMQPPKLFTYPRAGGTERRPSKNLAQNGQRIVDSKADRLLRELYN